MEFFFAPWFFSFALLVAGVQYYIGCILVGGPIPFRGLKNAGYMLMNDSYKVLTSLFIVNAFMFFVTLQAPFLESIILTIRSQAQSAIDQAVSAHNMNIIAVIILGLVVFIIALIRYLIEDIMTFNFLKILLDINKAMKQGAGAASTLAGVLAPLSMIYGILVLVQAFFVMFAQLIYYNWAWLAGLGVLFYLLPFRIGRRAGILLIGFSIVSYLMLPLYGGFSVAFQSYVTQRYWLAQIFPINLAISYIVFPVIYFGFVSWMLVGLGALGWTPLRQVAGLDWSGEVSSFARGISRAVMRAGSSIVSGLRGSGDEEGEEEGGGRRGTEDEEEERGRVGGGRGGKGRGDTGEEEGRELGGRGRGGRDDGGRPTDRGGPHQTGGEYDRGGRGREGEPTDRGEPRRAGRPEERGTGRRRESIEDWYEQTRQPSQQAYGERLRVKPEVTQDISVEPEVFRPTTSRVVRNTRIEADSSVPPRVVENTESTLMNLPEEDTAAMRNIQLRREGSIRVAGSLGMDVKGSLAGGKEGAYGIAEKGGRMESRLPTDTIGKMKPPTMTEYYPSLRESHMFGVSGEGADSSIHHNVGHGTFSESLPAQKQEEWNRVWQEMKDSGYLDDKDVPWETKVSPQEGYAQFYDKYVASREGVPEQAQKFFDEMYEAGYEPKSVRRKLPRMGE